MGHLYRVGAIRVQPDALDKLGEHDYDVRSFKRSVVELTVDTVGVPSHYKIRIDHRSGVVTFDADKPHVPPILIFLALRLGMKKLMGAPGADLLVPVGKLSDGTTRYNTKDPDRLLGFLHRFREEGPFDQIDLNE